MSIHKIFLLFCLIFLSSCVHRFSTNVARDYNFKEIEEGDTIIFGKINFYDFRFSSEESNDITDNCRTFPNKRVSKKEPSLFPDENGFYLVKISARDKDVPLTVPFLHRIHGLSCSFKGRKRLKGDLDYVIPVKELGKIIYMGDLEINITDRFIKERGRKTYVFKAQVHDRMERSYSILNKKFPEVSHFKGKPIKSLLGKALPKEYERRPSPKYETRPY
ncbi:MAG: hypothetical protein ACTSXQ_06615 [Alphaproteobacteria bacterium]